MSSFSPASSSYGVSVFLASACHTRVKESTSEVKGQQLNVNSER
jgi:hypothetical protein